MCNPINCRWGQKAFENYLGKNNTDAWKEYDATELANGFANKQSNFEILIDQGTKDGFLTHGDDNHDQLRPQSFIKACQEGNITLNLRMQEGYDHSYFFIASFVGDHIRFHAQLSLVFCRTRAAGRGEMFPRSRHASFFLLPVH